MRRKIQDDHGFVYCRQEPRNHTVRSIAVIKSRIGPHTAEEGTNLRFVGSICLATLTAVAAPAFAQSNDIFNHWPQNYSPREVGKRLADHFVVSPHQYTASMHYAEVAGWYGALNYAKLTNDDALRASLIHRFEPLMPGGAEANMRPTRRHVDDSIFDVVPLEIGLETHDAKYLTEGKWWADRQWEHPQPDGLSAETRYWIDDMYMLTMLQLEAYRATGDRKYLDRDALEMAAYLDKLQQPNGLSIMRRMCRSIGVAETAG